MAALRFSMCLLVYAILLLTVCFAFKPLNRKSRESRFKRHLIKRQQGHCGTGYFQCANGKCIQTEWTCDTDNDCGDNSDETLPSCPAPGHCTGAHEFLCQNHVKCIAIDYHCDGNNDCGDHSDELHCGAADCPLGMVRCGPTGICIDTDWLCDGDKDCTDGWDEVPLHCQPHQG